MTIGRYTNPYKTMLWCCKSQKSKYTFNYKTMKHLNGGKQDKSVWDIGICIGGERLKDENGKKIHSTQKPEKLLYKIILSTSKPNDVVLDPFFGSGTAGSVAKLLGRHYIGLEKEEKYIEAAKRRIEKVKTDSSDIHNLALEIKPPRVNIKRLIEGGYLKIGEQLYNKNGDKIAVLADNGYAYDGQNILSIHKMSAKYLNLSNNNGWDYFYFKQNNELTPINNLRYEYSEKNHDYI